MRKTIPPVMCVALLLVALPAAAQSLGRELTVETDKLTVELGEPVYVTATVTNVGSVPIDVEEALDPQTGTIDIYIVGPDGAVKQFLPLFYSDSTIPEVALDPGDHVASTFPIFFGSSAWSFPEPGMYRVSAEYHFEGHLRVDSNALSVNVAPGDAGNALVSNSAAGLEAGKFMLWQHGDHLEKGQRHLQQILDDHPESVVASYVRLARGRNLSRSFRDYTRDRIRHPQCEDALSYLDAVEVNALPTYLQLLHALSVERCRALEGDHEAALAQRSRAEMLGAGRDEFRRVLARP